MEHTSRETHRQVELSNIRRIMTRPINDVRGAIRESEELIIQLASEIDRLQKAKDPEWWHCQDMIDDAFDLLDFLKIISTPAQCNTCTAVESRRALELK